ncbi:hypothetical protein KI248_gp16 [Mycobacterium phage Phaded]|uniref:Gp84-like domain-containing protein n=1 Tax=Mycobacterium phage Phaded TaxID=2686088 RepID=A0A6B9JB45_9CAUD|nr:hypothetical protein KI248_gp16 [Mycobacterium phage Phaded]QGZ16883.1 hypothetical protein SEA_PHADED_83 [Mycobacterium phage Phaded]
MYELLVTRVGTDKSVTEKATRPVVLIDHLESAAGRAGMEVVHIRDNVQGDVLKDGQIVAEWSVTVE